MTRDYIIAIPSHRRAAILRDTTLAYLKGTNVSLDDVCVFVSDEDDAREYRDIGVRVIAPTPDMRVRNATDKFNWIHFHFEPGTKVFVMEDDVQLITGAPGSNKTSVLQDLATMIHCGFTMLPNGQGIFGIAPHSNGFYFTGKASFALKLVVAHAYGFVSTRSRALAVKQPSKTDYERSCLYFKRYGYTLRLDWYGVVTKSYTQPGGMQSDHTRDERRELERVACEALVKKFPDYLRLNEKKKSLFPELSFKRVQSTIGL